MKPSPSVLGDLEYTYVAFVQLACGLLCSQHCDPSRLAWILKTFSGRWRSWFVREEKWLTDAPAPAEFDSAGRTAHSVWHGEEGERREQDFGRNKEVGPCVWRAFSSRMVWSASSEC